MLLCVLGKGFFLDCLRLTATRNDKQQADEACKFHIILDWFVGFMAAKVMKNG